MSKKNIINLKILFMSIIKSCFKLFVILIIISLVSCEAEEAYVQSRTFGKKTNQARV